MKMLKSALFQHRHSSLTPCALILHLLLITIAGKYAEGLAKKDIALEKEAAIRKFSLRCKDTCAEVSDQADDNFMHACMCDESCSMYGDCCADAEDINRTTKGSWVNQFECFDLGPDQIGADGFFMIVNCPSGWSDTSVRDLCENPDKLMNDPFMNTPVTNKLTTRTFRNPYCALCNNELLPTGIRFWTPNAVCPNLPRRITVSHSNTKLSWDEEGNTWNIEVSTNGLQRHSACTISYSVPEDLRNVTRSCVPYVKTSCTSDYELQTLCRAYLAPIEVNGTTYRNLHCAACAGTIQNLKDGSGHSHKDSDLQCGVRTQFSDFLGPRTSTFSVLFDFRSTVTSDMVGYVCKSGDLFDPFHKKCRTVFCPQNKILRQGKCVIKPRHTADVLGHGRTLENEETIKKSDASPATTEMTWTENGTCAKIQLETTEYELKENATIYVMRYQKLLGLGEYEQINQSIFVCANDLAEAEKFDKYLRGFSIFFLGLSEICLLIHMGFGFVTEDFKNLSGKNIQSLSFSLFMGFGVFLIMQFVKVNTTGCVILAVLGHYFFLSAFWWSSVMAFDVFRTLRLATTQLRSPSKPTCRFILYSLWAWLTPAFLVSAAVAIDFQEIIPPQFHPHYGRDICWIGQKTALLVYFILPLAAILVLNFILFFWTLHIIQSHSVNQADSKREAILYVRLAVLMGLSWVTGIIAGATEITALWYVFVFLCASQGVSILLVFTLNSKTAKTWYGNRTYSTSPTSRSTSSSILTYTRNALPSFYGGTKQVPHLVKSQEKATRLF